MLLEASSTVSAPGIISSSSCDQSMRMEFQSRDLHKNTTNWSFRVVAIHICFLLFCRRPFYSCSCYCLLGCDVHCRETLTIPPSYYKRQSETDLLCHSCYSHLFSWRMYVWVCVSIYVAILHINSTLCDAPIKLFMYFQSLKWRSMFEPVADTVLSQNWNFALGVLNSIGLGILLKKAHFSICLRPISLNMNEQT